LNTFCDTESGEKINGAASDLCFFHWNTSSFVLGWITKHTSLNLCFVFNSLGYIATPF